jgi:hypothetical protein
MAFIGGKTMPLVLPQPNNSQIRIPRNSNYRRVLEAYGFDISLDDGRTLLMSRNFPDDNGFEGAWQERLRVPPEFEAEIQRQIEIVE